MRHGRRFTLPIDPWPRASLAERMSVTLVLGLLLLVPFCAAGLGILVFAALGLHVLHSYDLGASLRALIDRRAVRGAAEAPPARPVVRVP